VNLINEKQIKLVYVNGTSEVVDIKDIGLSDKNLHKFQSQSTLDLILEVNKEEKKNEVFLRIRAWNEVCFADLDILLAIINKNIKKLSTE
jgi:hypothetical protein